MLHGFEQPKPLNSMSSTTMKAIRTGTASLEHIQVHQGEQPWPCSLVVDHISISENPKEHA